MNATNKEFGSPHCFRRKAQGLFVRCGWLSIYACALLIVSLYPRCCLATARRGGGEIIIDEDARMMASAELGRMSSVEALDPIFLLSTDSEQNEEEPALLDIQMPPHPGAPGDYYTPGLIDGLAINFASAVKNELSQTTPRSANTSSEQLERQLRKSRISPPNQPRADSGSALLTTSRTDDLRQLIEQIRSIEVEPQKPAQQPVDTVPAPAPQPATPAKPEVLVSDFNESASTDSGYEQSGPELSSRRLVSAQPSAGLGAVAGSAEPEPGLGQEAKAVTGQPAQATFQTEVTAKSMSDHTLKMIDDLLKDANHITNPMELADVLFQSGRPGPAWLCYKQALASIAADDPNLAGNRAWILFQIGNCLKDDDPNTARESYAELIRTHPDSPWAEVAKVQYALIDWYQQDQPRKLIQPSNP